MHRENVFYFTYRCSARAVRWQFLCSYSTIAEARHVSVNERFKLPPALTRGVSPGRLRRAGFGESYLVLRRCSCSAQMWARLSTRYQARLGRQFGYGICQTPQTKVLHGSSVCCPADPMRKENGCRIGTGNEQNLLQFSIGTRFDTGYPRFSSYDGCSGGDIHG